MSNIDFVSYYKLMFLLKDNTLERPFSLQETEEMYPWERDIYLSLIQNLVNERNEAARNQQYNN